ncbi:putative transcriptional regulator, GntR family protein [Oceanicola granulosus HTCC2516]|uniref:Putative transcriptional regulator, GntR family protein n=1 Tax=Oceanicola granulosus (strain ATCC BAA-861 / DSM 15982 / KCTC 12143 / HTCC2516) TaxID=314256 RepID=Q2CHC2_OCEGH|nr:GntR family transcriptional regulator [Oceanicola granulosus]EAR52117.1 putative transcriptional regulator, GntR family protein [Oceanicola granulosus HTCC2516]
MKKPHLASNHAARPKGALHQQTTDRLREMIVSGELKPGERLREAHYCEELNVSRTPFREAVRTLMAEGLIEQLPNHSAVVAGLDVDDLKELYEVVAALEALAGELACQMATRKDISDIVSIHSQMLDCYERRERSAYLKLNHEIHKRVVEISGNRTLLASWQALVPKVERARAMANLDEGRWLAAVTEHSRMLSALASGDGAALADLTRQHFANGLPYSQAQLQGDGAAHPGARSAILHPKTPDRG